MGKMTRTAVSLNKAAIGAKREQARYYTPGKYRSRIEGVKIVTRRRDKIQLFMLETTILESEGELAQKPGRCSWSIKLGLDAAPGNIKEVMVAASGIDPQDAAAVDAAEEDWDAVLELALEDEQPFKGVEILIEAQHRFADDGTVKFTKCYFSPA